MQQQFGSYPGLPGDQDLNNSMNSAARLESQPNMTMASNLPMSPHILGGGGQGTLDATGLQRASAPGSHRAIGIRKESEEAAIPGSQTTQQSPDINAGPNLNNLKDERHNCYHYGCTNLSPFICKGSILCSELGCTQAICAEHKGQLSVFYRQQHDFAPDEIQWESEAICADCVVDANKRVNCIVGIPFFCMVIVAIICLILSVMGIADAITEANFDDRRDVYYPDDWE